MHICTVCICQIFGVLPEVQSEYLITSTQSLAYISYSEDPVEAGITPLPKLQWLVSCLDGRLLRAPARLK